MPRMNTGSIINIDCNEELLSLKEECSLIPDADELPFHFMKDIFPRLDMAGWISTILERVPEGHFTTFGAVARGLGTVKASRAVGELISRGKVRGPIHRIIYSNGSVPEKMKSELMQEIDIPIDPKDRLEFQLDAPPLSSLMELQGSLSKAPEPGSRKIGSLAGLDISSRDGIHCAAASIQDLEGTELTTSVHFGSPPMPYVPGLLFFREAPLLIPLCQRMENQGRIDESTLLVLDGNGIIHPRRMGIARQIGIVLGRMSCGIAKRLMMGTCGTHLAIDEKRSIAEIKDGNELLGYSLQKIGSRPVYLSRGCGVEDHIMKDLIVGVWKHRIPEPTRRAHTAANKARETSPAGQF